MHKKLLLIIGLLFNMQTFSSECLKSLLACFKQSTPYQRVEGVSNSSDLGIEQVSDNPELWPSISAAIKKCNEDNPHQLELFNKYLSDHQDKINQYFVTERWTYEIMIRPSYILHNLGFEEDTYVPRVTFSGRPSHGDSNLGELNQLEDILKPFYTTHLDEACFLQKPKLVELLLDRGADSTEVTVNRMSLLHRTFYYYGNYFFKTQSDKKEKRDKLLTILAKTGNHLNIADTYGITPLMLAYATQQGSLARTMLQNGADINQKNMNGNTVLHFIAQCSSRKDGLSAMNLVFSHATFIKKNDGTIIKKPLFQEPSNTILGASAQFHTQE